MTFLQAAAAARTLIRGSADTGDDSAHGGMPVTNLDALIAYKSATANSINATRVLKHLPEWLANKPVASTTEKNYRDFVKVLVSKGLAQASIKRTCKGFAAALVLAARDDKRITNASAWKEGFANRRSGTSSGNGPTQVRNYATDAQIVALVAACYERDHALGLWTEVAAQTGARPIQIARLQVVSLQLDPPCLMMPASNKGQKDSPAPSKLPIKHELADKLRKAAHGRRIVDPLLLQSDGQPFCRPAKNGVMTVTKAFRTPFEAITEALGLDPEFSFYGLRHCSIIRQLQRGVPMRIVAAGHDTSVEIIEKHYGAYIVDLSDELIRAALLDTSPTPTPPAGNVVQLRS
jgi:integrase